MQEKDSAKENSQNINEKVIFTGHTFIIVHIWSKITLENLSDRCISMRVGGGIGGLLPVPDKINGIQTGVYLIGTYDFVKISRTKILM